MYIDKNRDHVIGCLRFFLENFYDAGCGNFDLAAPAGIHKVAEKLGETKLVFSKTLTYKIDVVTNGILKEITVTFHCRRPGILIGRRGWSADAIQEHLEKSFKGEYKIKIDVKDIRDCFGDI